MAQAGGCSRNSNTDGRTRNQELLPVWKMAKVAVWLHMPPKRKRRKLYRQLLLVESAANMRHVD